MEAQGKETMNISTLQPTPVFSHAARGTSTAAAKRSFFSATTAAETTGFCYLSHNTNSVGAVSSGGCDMSIIHRSLCFRVNLILCVVQLQYWQTLYKNAIALLRVMALSFN